jgi:hypothetical protein
VAVIQFFGDDNADAAPQRVQAVAGYVAVVDEWDRLSEEWLDVIHDQAWPSPISRFHAAECESQQGEFTSWSTRQCTDLVTRLVDVILNPAYKTMEGIGGAVFLDDLGAAPGTFPAHLRTRIGFLMGSQLVFAWVLGIPLSRHGDRIEFIFDSQPDLVGRVLQLFQILREPPDRELVPALKFRLEEPIFRSNRLTPPLQAADLLAYNTQKHLVNLRFEPERPMRRALERLVAGRTHRGAVIDQRFFAEIKRRDAAGESLHFQPPDIYRTTLLEHEPPYDRD